MGKIKGYYYAAITKVLETLFKASDSIALGKYILMFHNVGAGKTSPKEFYSNIDDFKDYIGELNKTSGIVSLEDCLNGKGIALTFDDGFECFYSELMKFFEQENIPFTIFMSTGFLGKGGYLTKEQLVSLSKNKLCTIGSHTVTHCALRTSPNALLEMTESKKELEQLIGTSVDYFAYPYGSATMCSIKNIMQAKKAGYVKAFSTIRGCVTNHFCGNYFIPRINGDHLVIKKKENQI